MDRVIKSKRSAEYRFKDYSMDSRLGYKNGDPDPNIDMNKSAQFIKFSDDETVAPVMEEVIMILIY